MRQFTEFIARLLFCATLVFGSVILTRAAHAQATVVVYVDGPDGLTIGQGATGEDCEPT